MGVPRLSINSTPTVPKFPSIPLSEAKMASSKTLAEFFNPAKRLKSVPSPETLILKSSISCNSSPSNESSDPENLTTDQKSRIEINKYSALAKRNLRVCTERVSKSKGISSSSFFFISCIVSAEGMEYVKLEELLVEDSWMKVLPGELQKPYAKNLCRFVEREVRGSVAIYPPQYLIFNALNSTPFDRVKAVILGQDPYHGPGQAMGLAFSVPEGIKVPSSLVNIFKELQQDLGCSIPSHGNLERWAVQGVLLLNTVLTVRNHQANSHAKKGWELFTDAIIRTISLKKSGVVFLLWGNSAQEKSRLIDEAKHHILRAAHPSGLSANRGFFGCRHFSQTNKILEGKGHVLIDWQL
ncbi:uracil-DNA glycosylase, mitochondrial-like protein [Cinnamomum micranthum f. kanehirae]|uniref:Uracil-DNA glycosylase n=1 Tax=Cinnamomum micranthum f. kanehirae TaxID=337451 RepID=A0A3S3MS07_9MAGN|nr:uracil-DNA glycosylase, mitochondrial-like protein [Cinnamomum micranthum f. kanehirae]